MSKSEYLEILFNDVGFNRATRKAWLSDRLGRDIVFLDDLSPQEAHGVIEELKALKKERRNR